MSTADPQALPVTAGLIERMFPKVRIRLVAEDYRALTQRLLDDSIPHYKPTVTIEATA